MPRFARSWRRDHRRIKAKPQHQLRHSVALNPREYDSLDGGNCRHGFIEHEMVVRSWNDKYRQGPLGDFRHYSGIVNLAA